MALWLLPAGLALAAALSGLTALLLVAALLLVLYAMVWLLARPRRFEVGPAGLDVVFPLWRRTIPAFDGLRARLIGARDFQREFGLPLRIGAGGLWGGFGWLWTTRGGMVEFYVSRTDGLVLVERLRGRPLLITPETPAALVEALGRLR